MLARLGVEAGGYLLVTLHRAENVDVAERLRSLVEALGASAASTRCRFWSAPIPRTPRPPRAIPAAGGVAGDVRFLEPLWLFRFCPAGASARLRAERQRHGAGGMRACFGVPNVTLRDVTERPETIECGSNILSGGEVEGVSRAARLALSLPPRWTAPPEYRASAVSDTVVRIVAGYHHGLGGFRG